MVTIKENGKLVKEHKAKEQESKQLGISDTYKNECGISLCLSLM